MNKAKLNTILLIIATTLNIASTITLWSSFAIICSSLFIDDINTSYWIKIWAIPSLVIQMLSSYLVDHYCKILNINLES